MSTISTIFQLAHHARRGESLQDKWLAFLIAGLGALGEHRLKIRPWFLKQIDRFAQINSIQMKLFINDRLSYFSMRQGNEADYLIGGELVRGGYEIPTFKPKTIIDGGANIDMFAIKALSYFPDTKLICYEPDTVNYEQLQKNLKLNDIDADVHKLGLWSKQTTLYYHVQSSHTGYIDENPSEVAIPCTVPKIDSDCWLKLDIEGAEYEVLPALLEQGQYPRWISLEIHDFDLKGKTIISLLQQHGYQINGGEDFTVDCTVISAYRD